MRRMYSQNELEKLVKDVFLADVESGEIDFPALIEAGMESADLTDIDLVVKTLKALQPNWEIELELTPSSTIVNAGLDTENIYCKFQVFGNILYYVMLFKITNNTGASVTSNYLFSAYTYVDLPEEIANKIFDYSGKTAHVSSEEIISLNWGSAMVSPASFYDGKVVIQNTPTANRIYVRVQMNQSGNIADGGYQMLEGRGFLVI